MKKSICITITIIILLSFIGVNNEASATTYNNKSVAIKWTEKHYKGYKIKVVKYNCVPTKRKSNKTIYIETLPTISDGGYNGHCTINGAYVRYSKKVPSLQVIDANRNNWQTTDKLLWTTINNLNWMN